MTKPKLDRGRFAPSRWRHLLVACGVLGSVAIVSGCSSSSDSAAEPIAPPMVSGQDVFRFETFGNERFWTDVMRLPQGIVAAELTPLQALGLGLQVNVGALSAGTTDALLGALAQVENGVNPEETALGSPAVTAVLINEGAVIGVVGIDADGKRMPLGSEDGYDPDVMFTRVGVSCALCHATTDGSVVPVGFVGPGSVGVPLDGRINEGLDVGAIFAAAQNPAAYLPFLQLKFDDSLGGASLGKTDFPGIPTSATVDEITTAARQFLTGTDASTGERHYPRSHFDATPDGIGNPTYFPPFFRTDLAAPWGSSGTFDKLSDFNNLVYTVALDPTVLVTSNGRAFLETLAGPVGTEIVDTYERVLRATASDVLPQGSNPDDVFPLIQAARTDVQVGSLAGVVGLRVDEVKLAALNAYTDALPAPPAPSDTDAQLAAMGEQIFMTPRNMGGANCVACHTGNPNQPVEFDRIRPITQLYRQYEDDILTLFERPGITNVQTTLAGPNPEYDLSLVVLDASLRGEPITNPGAKPGIAKPLLLGLADKDEFLHDGSIGGSNARDGLNRLLDPQRGPNSPHPFYFPGVNAQGELQSGALLGGGDGSDGRRALVEYLISRTTSD
ncbi:MAG: hypothetical protein ACK4IT_03220 [Thioalkalivibrionaceae bacterium]